MIKIIALTCPIHQARLVFKPQTYNTYYCKASPIKYFKETLDHYQLILAQQRIAEKTLKVFQRDLYETKSEFSKSIFYKNKILLKRFEVYIHPKVSPETLLGMLIIL